MLVASWSASSLLYLSRHKRLRRWMETSATAVRLTRRFVAGNVLEDALAVSARLNQECIAVSLDHLGESVTSLEEAEASRDSYIEALEKIAARGFEASVSIKLTQFGLDLSERACRRNVEQLVGHAARLGKRVEIDMESSEYVDRTLDTAIAMHQAHHNVRAVIQAYLLSQRKGLRAPLGTGFARAAVQGRLQRGRRGGLPDEEATWMPTTCGS